MPGKVQVSKEQRNKKKTTIVKNDYGGYAKVNDYQLRLATTNRR